MHETGLLDLLSGSGRPRTSRSFVVQRGAVADWWYSWPMASILASLCLSQIWTFWTYVVTINLFSLYLMLHTMLDATGVVLRVHYKSMKCDVLFSQGSVRTIFRWGGYFLYRSKKFLPLYNSTNFMKSIDILQSYGHKCTAAFLWFTVYYHAMSRVVIKTERCLARTTYGRSADVGRQWRSCGAALSWSRRRIAYHILS